MDCNGDFQHRVVMARLAQIQGEVESNTFMTRVVWAGVVMNILIVAMIAFKVL